jgi:hypothetical protein
MKKNKLLDDIPYLIGSFSVLGISYLYGWKLALLIVLFTYSTSIQHKINDHKEEKK